MEIDGEISQSNNDSKNESPYEQIEDLDNSNNFNYFHVIISDWG